MENGRAIRGTHVTVQVPVLSSVVDILTAAASKICAHNKKITHDKFSVRFNITLTYYSYHC